jgi:transposase-like protein
MTNEMIRENDAIAKLLTGPQGDFLRDALQRLVEGLMEADVKELVGAERYERSDERRGHRNGYREREWHTRLGAMMLSVPRVRETSYMPDFLEPRRRAERALVSVVQEAYIKGVSTRRVDDLVNALGGVRISKSEVSRQCMELDEEAREFRERVLDQEVPYVWLDAVYEKVREGGRVISMAVVVAIGVTADGTRTVLGLDVGHTESEAFWKSFLRTLVRRGLGGVQLVISDAHEGLKAAISSVLTGATWQRCRVHMMRNVLCHVKSDQQAMVAAAIRTIFAQPSQQEALEQLDTVVAALRKKSPKAADTLEAAADDVLAYKAFPPEHHKQIHSTNPLERQNKEIRRRTRVVGVFPNRASILRLVTLLLSEQDDEWQAASRAYMSQTSMAKVTDSVTTPPQLMKGVSTG